jgi:hypothetical protein
MQVTGQETTVPLPARAGLFVEGPVPTTEPAQMPDAEDQLERGQGDEGEDHQASQRVEHRPPLLTQTVVAEVHLEQQRLAARGTDGGVDLEEAVLQQPFPGVLAVVEVADRDSGTRGAQGRELVAPEREDAADLRHRRCRPPFPDGTRS